MFDEVGAGVAMSGEPRSVMENPRLSYEAALRLILAVRTRQLPMNDLSFGTQSAYISVINRRDYRFSALPCARDPTRHGLPFQDPLDMRSRHIRFGIRHNGVWQVTSGGAPATPQEIWDILWRCAIPLSEDRRMFTPVVRSSYVWKEHYDKHSAVERVNSRLAGSFGFDDPFIRGLAKMRLRCTMALSIMLAMALGRIEAGQREHLRSLTKAPEPPDSSRTGTAPAVVRAVALSRPADRLVPRTCSSSPPRTECARSTDTCGVGPSRVGRAVRERIRRAIYRYAGHQPRDVRRLRGYRREWRLRTGS